MHGRLYEWMLYAGNIALHLCINQLLWCYRTTLVAISTFLEAFQKVADMATNTRGEYKPISYCMWIFQSTATQGFESHFYYRINCIATEKPHLHVHVQYKEQDLPGALKVYPDCQCLIPFSCALMQPLYIGFSILACSSIRLMSNIALGCLK